MLLRLTFFFFFFNDTATTEIYTLSLHDALPICCRCPTSCAPRPGVASGARPRASSWCCCRADRLTWRSEEHTSELQSQSNLVCRLLLEKKKTGKDNCVEICLGICRTRIQHYEMS